MKFSALLKLFLLLVNAFVGGLLILSAYSPYLINPVTHPVQSCIGLAFPVFLILNVAFLLFWLFVRVKFIWLPFFIGLVCFPQIRVYVPYNKTEKSSELPSKSIKLLSYNSMGFGAGKKTGGVNNILEYLKQSEADIICIQEYAEAQGRSRVNKKDIERALKAYPYKKVHLIGKRGSMNRLACFSKFPILSSRMLDYKSDYNGSVLYHIKVGADTLLLINNHLESNKLTREDREVYSDMIQTPSREILQAGARQLLHKLAEATAIRARQADSIASVVGEAKDHFVVVCGDFNDSPISYTHRAISRHLKDAFVESGSGLGISYNQNRFYFRIDHILTSDNIRAYNCQVDRSVKDSDHYPIFCWLSFEK